MRTSVEQLAGRDGIAEGGVEREEGGVYVEFAVKSKLQDARMQGEAEAERVQALRRRGNVWEFGRGAKWRAKKRRERRGEAERRKARRMELWAKASGGEGRRERMERA